MNNEMNLEMEARQEFQIKLYETVTLPTSEYRNKTWAMEASREIKMQMAEIKFHKVADTNSEIIT
jgi:hypothetical protein